MSDDALAQGQLFDARKALDERSFQKVVQRGLDREGWRFTHVRAMRTPDGRWLTGTSSPGFPDLLAVRPGFVLAVELKSIRGRVEPDQAAWLKDFYDAGALTWVLRPSDDWQAIARWIARPESAPPRWGW